MKIRPSSLKGFLRTLILAVLDEKPAHAYALLKKLQDRSLGVFSLTEGTIYPTMHKLEKEGSIKSIWVHNDRGNRIREYSLTKKGIKTLEEDSREWSYFKRAMDMIMEKQSDSN